MHATQNTILKRQHQTKTRYAVEPDKSILSDSGLVIMSNSLVHTSYSNLEIIT